MGILKDFFEDTMPKFAKPSNEVLLKSEWFWEQYPDGSGSLEHKTPKGYTSYFMYDKQPYGSQGGIEFRLSKDKDWNVFFGSFEDFKKFAEEQVVKMLALN